MMSEGESVLQRRQELWSLLGELPRDVVPKGVLVSEQRRGNATVQQWTLTLNDVEQVPAVLVLPDTRQTKAPVVLYAHTHSDDWDHGKSELFDGVAGVMDPYVDDLVDMGVIVLAIDSWCFGERKHKSDGRLGEQETFSRMLWDGRVLFGMMVFDLYQAVSWVTTLEFVDENRIGVLGMSMGATHAWWLAALDPRVRLCVDICCLTDYDALIETDAVGLHGVNYFVPRLRLHFDSGDINALIAPRPRLSLNGLHDPWSPNSGVRKIAARLESEYARLGVVDNLSVITFDIGHEETQEMRTEALDWIDRHLASSRHA